MLGWTFSSKLDWGPYIISNPKTASKKIGALIRSMKFLSPEVALHLYKLPYIHVWYTVSLVWDDAPSCYLELLDKLQKQICRIVGPSLAASLEPLTHCRNVARLSLFYRYCFGRCCSELTQLVQLVLIDMIDCMIFLSPFLDVCYIQGCLCQPVFSSHS